MTKTGRVIYFYIKTLRHILQLKMSNFKTISKMDDQKINVKKNFIFNKNNLLL